MSLFLKKPPTLEIPPEIIEAAQQEIIRRHAEEPLRYCRLNPAIERYARAWCDPKCKIVVFPASNAIGKTWGTAILLGWTLWPDLVPSVYDWFKVSILQKKPLLHPSFRLCSTPKEVEETGSFQQAIRKLWPPLLYRSEKARKAFPSVFYTNDSDWFGDVMTYEQSPNEFEGATRGIIIYNEPPPKEIRDRCVQRTRMGGMEVFPMTPLAEAAYIDDEICETAPQSQGRITVVTGEMEEACKQHSPNGHLDHDQIAYLISQMDPDEVEARSKGKFMHLAGVILKKFRETSFVANAPLQSNPLYPHFFCTDPAGFNKPFACLWGQVVPEPMHGLQILREWPPGSAGPMFAFEKMKNTDMRLDEYHKLWLEIESSLQIPRLHAVDYLQIMDKRFGHNKDVRTGKDLVEEFSEMNPPRDFVDSYSVGAGEPEMKTGIQRINDYLRFDNITKKAFLLIDPSCTNLIRSIKRWSLDPKTQKPKDDIWKNFCDVLRYICAASPRFEARMSDSEWTGDVHQPYYSTGV